ncbi:MAG: hypothetical protein M3680_27585 [Myxococcota bacterium]|nr:hypothetical protein [Myxococcota bacterium]
MPEGSEEAAAEPVRYLSRTDFVDQVATIESSTPFLSFGLVVAMPDDVALEIRLRRPDGELTAWQEMPAAWSEGGQRTMTLVLEQPATTLELRANPAPTFARVELSETEELPLEDEGELDDDDHAGARASHAGRWQPPASTLGIGDSQSLPYLGASGCSPTQSLLPGTRDIANMLRASFPGAASYGGYFCRKIVGGSGWSVHSTGRAIDLFVPLAGGQADNDLGDPIANWLVENAEYVGVSFVVWDRGSWGAHRPAGAKHKTYTGLHPHHDHLHIEVTPAAGASTTRWFTDGKPAANGGRSRTLDVAFQANTSNLWTLGRGDWRLGMLPGTSPSIAALRGGGVQVAFQSNTKSLWTVGAAGNKNWDLGLMAGTSPSITALTGGGFQVAFQASSGRLWTVGTAGMRDWSLGLMAGTSPSITALAGGGFQVAFQANTGALWTVGDAGGRNWNLGLAPGTSPSITGLPGGGFQVAFQANTSDLWTVGAAGNRNWSLGMKARTSPSITSLANGGFQVAIQANSGSLWTVGTAGHRDWQLGLNPSTSPGIRSLPGGGFEVTFQANTGTLWTVDSNGGRRDWRLGLATGASPAGS